MLACTKNLISTPLIDSYIMRDGFLLADSVLKRIDYMKEEINNRKTSQVN